MKIDTARNLALKALYKIEKEKAYSNIVLDEILNKNKGKLSNKDVGFISELVYGITTWKLTLDCIIQKYSNIKIKKMSDWVLGILRLGCYQIVFLDKVPKSAAVNECVNLCKKYAIKSSNFVNAILRKIEKQDYEELTKIEDPIERLSKSFALPLWLSEKWIEEYGIEQAEKIASNSNEKPNMSIRVNTLKTNKEEIKNILDQLNIGYEDGILDDFIALKNVRDITNFSLYKEGKISVQDEAAALTAVVLDPKEGESILDCCSAPGGKTTYLAEKMKNTGKIEAWDLYENRLKLVEENAKRLGITTIQTQQNDSTILKKEYIEQFDRVLLDVPCLGLGVIRRKPDIKWQRKQEDIQEITQIQDKILEIGSKYVKIGGYLLYSTCSLLKEENEERIEKFLKNNKFRQVAIENDSILKMKEKVVKDTQIELSPNKAHDGFYICLLQRTQ